uniref:Enoyl reductase (ER) domain-containing protein n=1 Tax=Globisporangium ultimum (strain ATCC 200006 / CBS 805.95 / DAOM BR144) TaxID=431595 RepID=K3XCM8_GLOUD
MASANLVFRHGERTSHHNLTCALEPVPTLAAHEVLVEVRGVTLNYRDLAISNGTYPFPVKDNVVPCSDSAGVVAAVGDAVEDISVGDRVVANFDRSNLYDHRRTGSTRSAVSSTARFVSTLQCSHRGREDPETCELSFTQLALSSAPASRLDALFGCIPLQPGQTVLFLGTGGVSITGLQLAKAAGAVTIITSSSDEKLQFVKDNFGVDHVINYRKTPDWAAEANRITHGRARLHHRDAQEDMPDVASMVLDKGCIVRGVVVGSKQLLEDVIRFVSNKNIQPYIHKTLGFSREGVLEAFDLLKSARHIGKIGIEVASKK